MNVDYRLCERCSGNGHILRSMRIGGVLDAIVNSICPACKGKKQVQSSVHIEKYRFVQFDEQKHPRGKPENAGQFTEKGNQHAKSVRQTDTSPDASPEKTAGTSEHINQGKPNKAINTDPAVSLSSRLKRNRDSADTSNTFALTIGQQSYNVRQEGNRWLYTDARKQNWTVLKPELIPALDKLLLYTHKQQFLSALEKTDNTVGSKLEKKLRIPKDYFLNAYFSLAEEGKVHQDPSNGKIQLGPAPPPKPIQPQPKIVEQTPEQIEVGRKKREEDERIAAERKKASDIETRKSRRDEALQSAVEVAKDYDIPADDLLKAAKDIFRERKQIDAERETVKDHARQLTGLTAADIRRLENSGHDYTSTKVGGVIGQRLRDFDGKAQQIAREHPGIIGDPDDPNADFAAGLWELLREGKQMMPSMYDDDILYQAARMVKSGRVEQQPEEEMIPFSRQLVKRSALQKIIEHYHKRGVVCQRYSA